MPRTPLTDLGYTLPRRPHGLLADMLMLADELLLDNDIDYTAWLDGLAATSAILLEQGQALPEWPMFLQALRCLNAAPCHERWRWIAIVSAIRPMIEGALERIEASHGRPRLTGAH
jgi:hypothetical protein